MSRALIRRTALTLGAAAVLAVAVVLGGRLETTTQVRSPAQTESNTPQLAAPIAAAAQGQLAPSSVPAPVALTPSGPAVSAAPLPDTAYGSTDLDLVRLRSRLLAIPVQNTTPAQLQDTYTQARAGGAPHDALDIMAPRGTPVLAVEDGRITKLFLSKPGGITLYQFDPDSAYAYYYAHLDSYAADITEGASVSKGQILGYVGSTGNALPDAPHLHFAIFKLGPERQWWRGSPINPYLIWRDAKP